MLHRSDNAKRVQKWNSQKGNTAEILPNCKQSYIHYSKHRSSQLQTCFDPACGMARPPPTRLLLLALPSGLIVPGLKLPREVLAVSVLADELVLAVAAPLAAVVALDLVDPARAPAGVVDL